MICQKCRKNKATTTITQNINGHVTVGHYCSECASKMGIASVGSVLGSMLGGMFADFVQPLETEKCRVCGRSFNDFTRYGKAGCPNCYIQFYPQLLPTLRRVHGKAAHIGKRPARLAAGKAGEQAATAQETGAAKIDSLKAELEKAVREQEYERAAQLRDEIKGLEG